MIALGLAAQMMLSSMLITLEPAADEGTSKIDPAAVEILDEQAAYDQKLIVEEALSEPDESAPGDKILHDPHPASYSSDENLNPVQEAQEFEQEALPGQEQPFNMTTGSGIHISVSCGEEAGLSDGTSLEVIEDQLAPVSADQISGAYSLYTDPDERAYVEARLRESLLLEDWDALIMANVLDLSLQENGTIVMPAAPVMAELHIDSLPESKASYVSAIALDGDAAGTCLAKGMAENGGVTLRFDTYCPTRLAVCVSAKEYAYWYKEDWSFSVYGPEGTELGCEDVSLDAAGLTVQEAQHLVCYTGDGTRPGLWIAVRPNEQATEAVREDAMLYALSDGIPTELLSENGFTNGLVYLGAANGFAVLTESAAEETFIDGEQLIETEQPIEDEQFIEDEQPIEIEQPVEDERHTEMEQSAETEQPAEVEDENTPVDGVTENIPADAENPDNASETDGEEPHTEQNIETGTEALSLSGSVPEGVAADAVDALEQVAELDLAALERAQLNAEEHADEQESLPAYRVLTAWTLDLTMDSEAWQPDENQTLTAHISHEEINAERDLQLWHVRYDEAGNPRLERIEDCTVQENTLSFPVKESGLYMISCTAGFRSDAVTVTGDQLPAGISAAMKSVAFDASQLGGLTGQSADEADMIIIDTQSFNAPALDLRQSLSVETINAVNAPLDMSMDTAPDAEQPGESKKAGESGVRYEVITAYDISLYQEEAGYQPDAEHPLDITISDAGIREAVQNGKTLQLWHVHEGAAPVQVENFEVNDDTVSFRVEDLSVFVVTYTVDFHWGDYTYSIAGESEIALSSLLEKLGVEEITVADVAEVAFSDPALVEVEAIKDEAEQTTDWLLRSLAPFSTDEKLTLTLKNGETVEIKVTDVDYQESDNLNDFLNDSTVFLYEGEAGEHPLSDTAILREGDSLQLNLSFSEIPEGQAGERQMALLAPMHYTFPAGLAVSDVQETVTINLQGGNTVLAAVTLEADSETGAPVLTITGNYDDDQKAAVSASTTAGFTLPVTVQPATVPGSYALGSGLTLSAVKPRNVKVTSFTAEDYDAVTGTITYTAVVEAESEIDEVNITDLTEASSSLQFESGSYLYARGDVPEGAPAAQVNSENVTPGTSAAFSGFPVTVAHMYYGDTITLTYTAKVLRGDYTGSGQAAVQNTVTISNSGNPSNDPDDDSASVTTEGISYTPLTREYVTLNGSWAYWKVTVNPDGYMLNGGSALTLEDTFDDKAAEDAEQAIDYTSVTINGSGVTYDYSSSTGTFVIPDNTPVTITYRTRITAQPGEAKTFRGTAVLKDTGGNTIASATAGAVTEAVVIYPSASDVTGTDYMLKLFVYADRQMQQGIGGATFILLDANQRPLEYKAGTDKGQPVTFTTGSDGYVGYVNIELPEDGGVSIEKNTGYYLEMKQAVAGYQKDNTLYSFMITDDPTYETGGFYQYYNGDTMKVRLYPVTEKTPDLNVAIRFSGSYALREDQQNAVTVTLQKLGDNDEWVKVDEDHDYTHDYTEQLYGAIAFPEAELIPGQYYRVIEENESPWDLPATIHLESNYYIDGAEVDNKYDPPAFYVNSADATVTVTIENRYEDPQLTIVKMDKNTGEDLPGAVFSVYKIVNGAESGEAVTTYTTDENGEIVIRGGESYESETLYGIKETTAPEHYLLPLKEEWHYFYFCNDEYLEPSILANLPEDATAINLTNSGDRITVDNQKEKVTIPVMKLWQGEQWPRNAEVKVGLYQSVDGSAAEPVLNEENTPRTAILTSAMPYNNTAFSSLPSRDIQGRNIVYSIKEESISGMDPLEAGFVPEYGVSSSGVYIVRNKPAATLTVSKQWVDLSDNPVTDPSVLAAQSSVTFDVYRSSAPFADSDPADGITNADMTAFVGTLTKVRENQSFGASDGWQLSINDLDKQNDLGDPYYYYVLETVPSFGNELYEVDVDAGTVTIKNKVAPQIVDLKVTKAALKDDPRVESLDRDFEFTLKLQMDETHPIRSWTLYTDTANPDNDLVTDWNGEVSFTLKPTKSITLSLPAGVHASVTEAYNPEYTVETASTGTGSSTGTDDNGRTFWYDVTAETPNAGLTYTNTLHVICKVVDNNGVPTPFESLKRALAFIRDNSDDFTAPWTIYMLEDYTIPATDIVEVQEGESLKLTTASTTDALFPFNGGVETDRAVITRGEAGDSMLKNAGTLTLENICLDGGNIPVACDGGLVHSSGTLKLEAGTTLRNSATNGKGGAVYVKGAVSIGDGVEITGNSATSASALYLRGELNMTGGSIRENIGASDGAVVIGDASDVVNLKHSPVIFGNTNAQGRAANLYIGVDRDNAVNVVTPGLDQSAHIGITAMEGHMLIGEQFATAEFGQTDNLNRFVNDVYGYRGKLKDGTSTNVVWDGLTVTIKKVVNPVGANPNDRFTISLSSSSIVQSTYVIDGTLDYTVTAARLNRPGRITLRNVKANDTITISPLPVGDYTISEEASNYTPAYTIVETGSSEDPTEIENGKFSAENSSTVTVTNTRRLAPVKLTKTLDDRLAGDAAVPFNFTVKLTEADGTPVKGFALYTDEENQDNNIETDTNGVATFTMSPTDAADAIQNFKAPVGAAMTITETVDPNYRITASAETMPAEGEGEAEEITDEDAGDNIFKFSVTDDGADVTFDNVRKMAEIELSKTLVGKVSKTEAFTFTLTLTNGAVPVANYIVYRDETNPENNITTDANGVATIPTKPFTFGENETEAKSIPLTIPEGTKLVVAETEVKKNVNGTEQPIYTTTYSVNGRSAATGTTATINAVSDSDKSIAFTNTRKMLTITVKNTVNGYAGNVVPFTYTAKVTDGGENQDDYDLNGFTDGVMTFELTTGQQNVLTVPYGATLTVTEGFIVGYGTTVKRGSVAAVEALSDTFVVTADVNPLQFTNSQLIGLRIVNNTSSTLENVKITVGKNNIYLVNEDQTGQERISSNKTATISVKAGKTAILEIQHDTSVTAEQNYTVSGTAPADGYYYTINNEPSFHEFADPAILRVYDAAAYEVKGKLRYSVQDSTVTFTEQPLVSFDSNGGSWTTEMDGYRDRDGDRKVYQKAVDSGETVARPTPDPVYPTAEGIAFLGWTTDEEYTKQDHSADTEIDPQKAYDFNKPVTAPVTLYAVWAKSARDERVVTVKNGLNTDVTVTVTLTNDDPSGSNYTLYEDTSDPANSIKTDENGTASFTLAAGASKNLTVPDGAKLVLSLESASLAVSSEYTLTASTDNKSHTVDSVDCDGTVTFIPGVCKITDSAGNILYKGDGTPAVYGTLSAAFTDYAGTLYTDATHTTAATQAAVKMLVDEYEISSKHTFPNKNMTLTTAGKDDADFPFLGIQDRSTLYRNSFTTDSLFAHTNASEITLTDIILDGRNVSVGAVNGGLINVNKSGAKLTVGTGVTMQNVVFADYGSNANGGAVYIENGTLAVNGGLFSNLNARQGGAIYAKSNALLSIEGTGICFENCSANASNGDGDGGAIYYNDKVNALTINGGQDKDNPGIVFDSCVAKGKTGSGGAIYVNTTSSQPVSISGCSFIECSAREETNTNAAYGGGGICADGVSAVTVSYCSFTACDTLSRGGGVVVYVANGGEVSVNHSTFERCNCKGQGGGMAVYQPNQENSSVPKETDARALTKLSVNGCEFSNCSSGTNNGSGGAIQCYLPRMEFTDSTFTDCWAGKEGGAVNNYFGNGYTVVWPGTYMNMTGCTFIRCRAEDRYQAEQPQHYGGAVNTKVKTVTVSNSYFEDCVSTLREGGALHLGGQGGGSTATITGSTFKNCTAKTGGGAVLASTETLEVSDSFFYGCQAFGVPAANYVYNNNNKKNQNGGGAISHSENSRGTSTQKTTLITNCIFAADPNGGTDALSCSTATNGGAIWTRANTNVTLNNLTIENATAGNYGGGVYLDTGVTKATITDGSIQNCQAVSGSAVYVGKNATFSGDLEVSGNIVSNINSGAIHGGTLYFEDDVNVENNSCSADSAFKHDVLMQNNNVTTIYTTANGLGSEAHIGVYVPDQYFNNRGTEGKAFGTFANSNYLDAFFNNRNSELYGCELGSDTYIYWGNYVCKITDADGNTLTRPNGRDAVYQRLSQALDEFTLVSGGDPVYIKMLIEDYTIRQTAAISNFPNANITLTTASVSDAEHPYRGTEGTVCTISRTSGTEQLFKLDNADAVFQLEGITLDGRNDKTTDTGNRRLIEAAQGALVINGGTTLQYGAASNGGAIEAAAAAQVTVNGVYDSASKEPTVRFINCKGTGTNKPNGGAIRAYNLNITNSSENTGEFGTAFINCSAYNGGAITSLGTSMAINGAFFDSCQTQSAGGAIYHNNWEANSTSTFKNCAFENCVTNGNTTWAHGGAIEARTAELSVEDCSFKNCSATSDGGAVYHGYVDGNNKPSGNREKTTIKNTTFDGCSTTGSDTSYNYGGSVYTQAKTVEVIDSSFKDSTATNHGGALYCQCSVNSSEAIISGTSFTNCASSRSGGYGGAIYSNTKALTLQKSSKSETTISNCTAPGYSGAVHMATSGSTLNITDSTVISACYANKGGAIYLPADVTMNLTDSPEFSQNGYTTQNGSVVNAAEGACIYLYEGSRINLQGSPKFSRNILPTLDRITNGGILDYVRQDVYLAGYESSDHNATNAASIYVVGELTGDTIWVWPEKDPHRLPNKQFAKIADGVTVTPESLSKLRNALADTVTGCSHGEYLAGVQVGSDTENVYWDKMYVVSFMKKDNKGIAVPDAEFTLYSDSDCKPENIVATAISADGEKDTDTHGTLLIRGTVEFTSIRIGAYYMKETVVPTSFKENNTTYLVLVGSPYLERNIISEDLWKDDGPLNVADAETLVPRHTTDVNKYYGIFPLDVNGKAVLRANLASSNVGIENIRNDYEVSFMKVDSSGDALPGAAFTIYSAILDSSSGQPETFEDGYPKLMLWSRDGENYPAPAESADGTAAFKDKDNKTLPKGMVYFRELPLGTYYLLETAYPERNGSGRHIFYAESDRVFKLVIAENETDPTKVDVTLSEWKPTEDDKTHYETLKTVSIDGTEYYVVSNQEVVCKLTDANDKLLYVQGHQVWENKTESSFKRFPAIYSTLEEGFAAAQNRSFVDANGNPVTVDALKLKVLKDFSLSEPVIYNSDRAITFTTAETKASKNDRYIYSTTRTSDTSRALITRAYSEDTSANADALITLANGADMTLQNIRLNGQKTRYDGRALHVTEGSELNILNNTRIENFKQEAASGSASDLRGGAILLDDNTKLTIDGGYNRTADFRRNTGTYGGAIAVGANCIVSITNAQFSGNQANNQGSGGAIYAGGYADVTVKDSSVTGNTAGLGSAVFAENQAAVTISGDSITGCSITGNTASGTNGGAINVGGENAKLYFGGNVTVFDNYGSLGVNQQMNLVLTEDSNEVINTTADGLDRGTIGVYAVEGIPFENHGLPGKPFGTFGDPDRLNPQVFRSDHALSLYGVRSESNPSDTSIYWVDVICKLTDADDKILYQNISLNISGKMEIHKAQAVYARITDYDGPEDVAKGFNVMIDGFDAAQGTLFVRDETQTTHTFSEYPYDTDTTVKLKMLKDYELDKSILYQDDRMVTFTTAETSGTEKDWGDYFTFNTDRTGADGKALITRAFNNESMIVDDGTRLTLTDITLDGAKNSYSANVDGGIVRVANDAALTITNGATLQNAETTGNGGAVYVSTRASATFSGGTINGNTAARGAGFYLAWDSADNHAILNLTGEPSFGGTDRKGGDSTDKDDLMGTEGNFVRRDSSFKTETDKEPTNGSKPYHKDNAGYYLVRQDIYIHDTATPHNAIRVTGEITSGDGTIWVWAQGNNEGNNHYEMLKQFAVFDGDGIDLSDNAKETSMKAFRNAQPDSNTNCGGDYLTGQKGDDVNGWKCIYWTGGFDVVFLKTDAYGGWKLDNGNKISEGLPGAVFTLYTDEVCTTPYVMTFTSGTGQTTKSAFSISSDGTATYKDKNGNSVTLEKGEVLLSKVPPKIFYLKETTPPSGYNRDENKTTVYQVEVSSTGELTMRKKDASGEYKEIFKEKRREMTENGVQTDLIQYVVMNIPEAERKVILRKVVKNSYEALQGAQFQISRYDGTQVSSNNETTFTSGANGVYFIDRLPYGVYYLHETAPVDKWFFLVISNDTADGSRDGVYVSPPYDTRDAAETAYKAYKPASGTATP